MGHDSESGHSVSIHLGGFKAGDPVQHAGVEPVGLYYQRRMQFGDVKPFGPHYLCTPRAI